MISTLRDFFGSGRSLAWAAAGCLSWCLFAPAQSSFDPYRPESAAYNAYVFPGLPNNLALPNQAREAADYNRLEQTGNLSRANSFGRYLDGLEKGGPNDDPFADRRRGPAIGVPYYRAERSADLDRRESATTARERDQAFFDDQGRRDRLYNQAMRERDPAKRARLLRELSKSSGLGPEMVRPKTFRAPATRPLDPREARRSSSSTRAEALAAEALKGTAPVVPRTVDSTPGVDDSTEAPVYVPTVPDTSTRFRRDIERERLKRAVAPKPKPRDVLPDRRPRLPNEHD